MVGPNQLLDPHLSIFNGPRFWVPGIQIFTVLFLVCVKRFMPKCTNSTCLSVQQFPPTTLYVLLLLVYNTQTSSFDLLETGQLSEKMFFLNVGDIDI